MEEEHKSYAGIRVINPVSQQPPNTNLPPFVTYEVSGVDPHGEFNIRRRFQQFFALRNKLVERFVGMYVPPISSKRASGNLDERYVERRRRFLNYFCQKMAQRPYLFDSDIFQTFIRGDPDFLRAARFISMHEYALITNVYDIEFRKQTEGADMPRVLLELQKQADVLKTVQKTLSNIKEHVQVVAQSKAQFIKDYCKLGTYLAYVFKSVLPKFEKTFIQRHDQSGESEFITKNELCKAGLEEYLFFCEDNSLDDYVETINYDIRQARALLEAIESRRHLQNRKNNFETVRRDVKEELQKLKAGRTTLKSIFTSGDKQAQIKEHETNIDQYERNESFLALCLPFSAISIHKEIIQFKTMRSTDYLLKIQGIARKQMRLLDYYGNFLRYGITKSTN